MKMSIVMVFTVIILCSIYLFSSTGRLFRRGGSEMAREERRDFGHADFYGRVRRVQWRTVAYHLYAP